MIQFKYESFLHIIFHHLGVPKVSCEESDLSLDVITAKPFHGNIFVKGRAKDSSCKQSYDYNSSNSYTLSLGKCGMQRLRSVSLLIW